MGTIPHDTGQTCPAENFTPRRPAASAARDRGSIRAAASRVRIGLLAPLVAPIVDRTVGLTGDQIGGTQTYLADLADRLAGRQHAVTLLAAPGSRVASVETVELPIGHLDLVPATFDRPSPRADLAA